MAVTSRSSKVIWSVDIGTRHRILSSTNYERIWDSCGK